MLEIKRIVDERIYKEEDSNGMFWLSGFQKFVMMKNISKSLAGRVAVLNLLSLSTKNIDRDIYYSSYMNTYIERDVSALQQVGKLEEFRSFVTYMAANTAQELKYDSISKVVGVSAPTIKE